MSDPPASPDPPPGPSPGRKRPWLGRLSTCLASFAGGVAVNDLSGPLGYNGLAGAIALLGVITAATWIRGLDPRARLPRRAPWLFLAPAACMATAAAFSSGTSAGILTAAAAIFTIGAILVARDLQSAERLLAGAGLIVGGAAVIAGCTASIAVGSTSLGAAIIPGAGAFLAAGIACIADRSKLAGAALIAAGAAFITAGVTLIAIKSALDALVNGAPGVALIFASGILTISEGLSLIISGRIRHYANTDPASRIQQRTAPVGSATVAVVIAGFLSEQLSTTKGHTPAGAEHLAELNPLTSVALIAILAAMNVGLVAIIGPRTIASQARQAIDWAIKAPQATQEPDQRRSPNRTGKHGG